ncbi:MAG: ATP-binding protein [Methylotenera sp.]|uniref:ATP-binding protein n=1 Tax=Methylotenera sp. TaxID=2051956 RepID=UPI002489F6EC|nr:ATP-binding protein [Methylotenera sp.]MDI1309327.1 ATP-binding protein [Methylotenera sp.]
MIDIIYKERTNLSTRLLAGRAFLIKTPQAALYLKLMSSWLTTGSQGAIIYGRPRLGKTSATRWTLHMLPEIIGRFPVVEIPVRGQFVASEKAFFQHLLTCIKHRHAMIGTAGDKRDRFSQWLINRAIRSPINGAVLFLDEAQLLQNQHYDWLVNISNELDKNGCRLFCLLVGQTELIEKKNELINEGREQIVGRFMVREHEFVGLVSEKDIISILNEFDHTIYPSGSDKLFAESFIPLGIHSGFKLASLGPGMWQTFEKLWLEQGLFGQINIPMHYFTSALISTLNIMVSKDKCNLSISHDVLVNAVSASGFKESLRILKAESRSRQ